MPLGNLAIATNDDKHTPITARQLVPSLRQLCPKFLAAAGGVPEFGDLGRDPGGWRAGAFFLPKFVIAGCTWSR